MQIPILSGTYTDNAVDFRVQYPLNLIPVATAQGISNGYLRPADGLVSAGTGPGVDRGGINWNGAHYRVMGTSLVQISEAGAVTTIGTIPGTDRVIFTYSFDYLAINGNSQLYLYDGMTLTQVTDPDLGTVVDVTWIDGYFLTTDGEFLVITELNDPFTVDPLKYGSSEVDPDPVEGLLKIRNEIYALNRYTVEVFTDVGGTGFPFERIQGAQLQRGCIGRNAKAVFLEQCAFVGGGRNESPAVWLGANGNTQKLSTREIDLILQEYTESQLSAVFMETRVDASYQQVLIHLPDQTLVYDAAASAALSQPVWFILSTSLTGSGSWRSTALVYVFDRWWTGDKASSTFGYLTDTISSHWGQRIGWSFQTGILYNEGRGAIIHELELVALTGRVALGQDPRISTTYSVDGMSYSQPKWVKAGKIGDRSQRLVWLQQGAMRNWRLQRFHGTSDAYASFARLEARLEGLNF